MSKSLSMSENSESSYTVLSELETSTKAPTSPSKTSRRERKVATQAETLEWHNKRWGASSSTLLLPGFPCPSFSTLAVMEDGNTEKVFSRESFSSDYVVVLFLPMDGSVDTTELEAFGAEVERLKSLQCQVVGVTGDSVLSIRKRAAACGFPILSDKSLVMAKAFGVKRRSGMMARGSFLLDKERRVLHCSVYPRCVARSAEEVVRQVVSAARQVDSSQAGEEPLPVAVEANVTILDMQDLDEKISDKKGNGERKPSNEEGSGETDNKKNSVVEDENEKSCELKEKCDKKAGDTEAESVTRVVDLQPPQVSGSGGLFNHLVRGFGTYFRQGF